MTTYNIGDRVRCIDDFDGNSLVLNATGTIVAVLDDGYSVEFDCNVEGHTCGGTAKDGHGWYLDKYCIALLEEDDNTENQIDILFNDIMFK